MEAHAWLEVSAEVRHALKSRAQPISLAKQEPLTTVVQEATQRVLQDSLKRTRVPDSHQPAKKSVSYCLSRCSSISVSEAEARVAVELGGGGLGAEGPGPAGGRGAAGGLTVAGLASPSLNS